LEEEIIAGDSGGIPQLTVPAISKIKVSLPDLSVQVRIADTLDKFRSILEDENSGISTELAYRKLQYEHYRSKLFTFNELVSA